MPRWAVGAAFFGLAVALSCSWMLLLQAWSPPQVVQGGLFSLVLIYAVGAASRLAAWAAPGRPTAVVAPPGAAPLVPAVRESAPVGPWQGAVACALLGVVGALGPDITPSGYFPDLEHYIPRYVLLALAVGFGLGAARRGRGLDRQLGVAVLVAGGGMVAYISRECLRIAPW